MSTQDDRRPKRARVGLKHQKPSTALSALLGQLRDEKADLSTAVNHSLKVTQRAASEDAVADDGFKGCIWSPDGSCLLSAQSNMLEVYEPHADVLQRVLHSKEGEAVYDYAWFPSMNSAVPQTCCFASISRGSPVHLWDAFSTDTLRASYTMENEAELPGWGVSLAMGGNSVIAGLKSGVSFWELERPGRPIRFFRPEGLTGVVSALRFDPESSLFAAGTYSGRVLMFDKEARTRAVFTAKVENGAGVTQVQFSPCGNRLFAGTRRGKFISCWDVRFFRGSNEPLVRVPRICGSYQRLGFDVFNHPRTGHLTVLTGTTQSTSVSCFDIDDTNDSKPAATPISFPDLGFTINGVSYNLLSQYLAVATGSRRKTGKDAWWDENSTSGEEEDATLAGGDKESSRLHCFAWA